MKSKRDIEGLNREMIMGLSGWQGLREEDLSRSGNTIFGIIDGRCECSQVDINFIR